MGIRRITKEKLTEWEETYTNKLPDSEKTEETRSCILSLNEVKALIAYIDERNQADPPANIDGIQIYLTRSNECPQVKRIVSRDIPQISFAIVPSEGINKFFEINGSVKCLYPGDYAEDKNGIVTTGGTTTQLCPPNCSK